MSEETPQAPVFHPEWDKPLVDGLAKIEAGLDAFGQVIPDSPALASGREGLQTVTQEALNKIVVQLRPERDALKLENATLRKQLEPSNSPPKPTTPTKPKYRDLKNLKTDPNWREYLKTFPQAVQDLVNGVYALVERDITAPLLSFAEADKDGGDRGVFGTMMRDRVFRRGSYRLSDLVMLTREYGCDLALRWAVRFLECLKQRVIKYQAFGRTWYIFANDNVSASPRPNDKEDTGAIRTAIKAARQLWEDRVLFPQHKALYDWAMWFIAQFMEYYTAVGIGLPKELTEQMKREGWFVGLPYDWVLHPLTALWHAHNDMLAMTGEEKYQKNRDFILGLILSAFHTVTVKKGTKHPSGYIYEQEVKLDIWSFNSPALTQLTKAKPLDKIQKTEQYVSKDKPLVAHMSVYAMFEPQLLRDMWLEDAPGIDAPFLARVTNGVYYSLFLGAHAVPWKAYKDGDVLTGVGYVYKGLEGFILRSWDETSAEGKAHKKATFRTDNGQLFAPAHYGEGGFYRKEGSVEGFPSAALIPFAPDDKYQAAMAQTDTRYNIPVEVNTAIKLSWEHEGRRVA